jgi:hypothetical protein
VWVVRREAEHGWALIKLLRRTERDAQQVYQQVYQQYRLSTHPLGLSVHWQPEPVYDIDACCTHIDWYGPSQHAVSNLLGNLMVGKLMK